MWEEIFIDFVDLQFLPDVDCYSEYSKSQSCSKVVCVYITIVLYV